MGTDYLGLLRRDKIKFICISVYFIESNDLPGFETLTGITAILLAMYYVYKTQTIDRNSRQD